MVKGTLTQVTEIIETPLKSARGTFQRMERALKESTGIVHSFTMETKKIITGIGMLSIRVSLKIPNPEQIVILLFCRCFLNSILGSSRSQLDG